MSQGIGGELCLPAPVDHIESGLRRLEGLETRLSRVGNVKSSSTTIPSRRPLHMKLRRDCTACWTRSSKPVWPGCRCSGGPDDDFGFVSEGWRAWQSRLPGELLGTSPLESTQTFTHIALSPQCPQRRRHAYHRQLHQTQSPNRRPRHHPVRQTSRYSMIPGPTMRRLACSKA